MHGFEFITHEKFRGVHAPITIRSHDHPLNVAALRDVFEREFPEIASYSPTEIQHAIVESASTDSTQFTVIVLKAVQPELEQSMHTIAQSFHASSGGPDFVQALQGNKVVIGKKLAQELSVMVGDPITFLYAQPEQKRKNNLALESVKSMVGGIFETGIDEFDSAVVLCSFAFLQQLFPGSQPTQMSIALHPGQNEQQVIGRLITRLGLDVFSWKELYPALVSALKLEKYGMLLILILIVLVASMNIMSLLFMQITHKRNDIAILKAMGMSTRQIQSVFLLMGTAISFLGSVVGLGMAFIVGALLDRYPLFTLPDAYYVSHLPIHMTVPLFICIFIIALFLGFLASLLPLSRIDNITLAKMLRT